MQWKKIDKASRVQNKGEYNDWKQQISDECYHHCVYCSIHENPWGGIDHYHIDHFRPKSKFVKLINDITNLYYACPVCNRFKSDDWPNDSNDLNVVCYPDPSDYDYSDLYEIDIKNYTLTGKYISSKYLINKLYLNRPQLVYERREFFLKIRAQTAINSLRESLNSLMTVKESAPDPGDYNALIMKAVDSILEITSFLHSRGNVIPYKLLEIRKSEK